MTATPAPLKIISLTDFYDPVIGGLERHVKGLAAELSRRGHHMAIATLAMPGDEGSDTVNGVAVHRIAGLSQRLLRRFYASSDRPFHPTLPDPLVMRSLDRLIGGLDVDIVLAHSWILHSFLPIKRRHRARLVAYMHDYGLICPRKTFQYHGRELCTGPSFRKCLGCAPGQYGVARGAALTTGVTLDSYMYDRIDRLIANSEAVAKATRTHPRASPDQRVTVIPPFLSPTTVDASAPRPGFMPADRATVLFVGALGQHKGVSVLLEAWRSLSPRPALVFLGTPQVDTPPFPEEVVVQENVEHDTVMAAYVHATVTVVPSVWPEPFGKVAVEAMSMGRPVIATDTGGLAEIVEDDVSGILVPPGDVPALRDALGRVLADAALRERLGKGAKRRAEAFSVQRAVDRHEQLYREAMGAGA